MKADVLAALNAGLAKAEPCALITDTATGVQALVVGRRTIGDANLIQTHLTEIQRLLAADQSRPIEGTTLYVRVYGPPPRMVVVGAVHIAQALVPMARLAGFDVTVIDPRAAFVRSGNFEGVTAIDAWPDEAMAQIALTPRTAVVTLTHDPKLDDPALAAALRSSAFYIGALGSRKTHAKRLQRLKGDGFGDDQLARIHGPVGLNINAVSPAEIAVSIMAQIIQTLRADAKADAPKDAEA
ncbi:MAG: XdhC family protein [Rhodospirillaceae bacterium]|nr:XdhC family protein [Rhodospirillaceae bacterium]